MGPILFLLAVLFILFTLVSLIVPRKALFFVPEPSRGKVLLYYGLPAVILLIIGTALTPSTLESALENPAETRKLSLSGRRLSTLPDEVKKLVVLEELDLSNNQLETVPEVIRSLDALVKIDLSENPISELPAWLSEMPNLQTVLLYETGIDTVSEQFASLDIRYKKAKQPNRSDEVETSDDLLADQQTIEDQEEDHTESFGEFALRRLLGNDFGHKRKFKKGEVYYDHPITKEAADQVGELMVTFGFFNDERAATVLLEQEDEEEPVILKMVVDETKLDEEVYELFKLIKTMVQSTAFPDDDMNLILVDSDLDELKTL
ncbi:MAG: leucine-rich repeat domain-containing protein [Bacteroidota bacterium]